MEPCDAYTKLLESHHEVVVVIYENVTQQVMLLFMPAAYLNYNFTCLPVFVKLNFVVGT